MSEDWSIRKCDVMIKNLSQIDGYKALVPILMEEMQSESVYMDSESERDSEIPFSEPNTEKIKSDTIGGTFEEVLNSISVDSSSCFSVDTKSSSLSSGKSLPTSFSKSEELCNSDDVLGESGIYLESLDRNYENSDESDVDSIDRFKIVEKMNFTDSDKESQTETFYENNVDSTPNSFEDSVALKSPSDDTIWLYDDDLGKYKEVGTNPSGFKLKKMSVEVKEDHAFNKYWASGAIKVRIKLRNVRKQLGMLNRALDDPIIVEQRTENSHPFICPFYCPVYNVPCDAMFRVTEQQFFIEHVSNKNCPYAPKFNVPVEQQVRCNKCGENIA